MRFLVFGFLKGERLGVSPPMVILPQCSMLGVQGVAKGKILSAERQVYGTPAAPSAGSVV